MALVGTGVLGLQTVTAIAPLGLLVAYSHFYRKDNPAGIMFGLLCILLYPAIILFVEAFNG